MAAITAGVWLTLLFSHAAAEQPIYTVSAAQPVADITGYLESISTPKPNGGRNDVTLSDRPFMATANLFEQWVSLRLSNPGTERLERFLIFSYPSLARAGVLGAPAAEPRVALVRYVDGRMPTELSHERGSNRFGIFRVILEPGESHTLVFKFEETPNAAALRIWEPEALRRYENFQNSLSGMYWGLLLAAMAILFSIRVLSQGPATLSGGFVALSALVFETASIGGAGPGITGGMLQFDMNNSAVVRGVALICAGILGLQFLRHLLVLKEEAPLAGVAVRCVQVLLLIALPLVLLVEFGPLVARAGAFLALITALTIVWITRYQMPQGLLLLPPGLSLLTLAGVGLLIVSLFQISSGLLLVEPLLHGLFVVGIVLFVFAAAVRATDGALTLEHVSSTYVPAFARDEAVGTAAPADGRSLVPTEIPSPKSTQKQPGPNANQGLWDWSVVDDKLYISPTLETMMGLPEGSLGGSEADWEAVVLDEDKAIYTDTLRQYLVEGNSSFAVEFRVHHKTKGFRWVNLRATGIAGDDGRMARCIGIVTDITAAKIAEEKLVREASHDALTGVGNRALMMSHLDWAIDEYRSNPVRNLVTGEIEHPALIVLDLDRFKSVNDGLGHKGGDRILVEIAERLTQAVGPRDAVARIGSDEFAVLILPAEDADKAGAATNPDAMADMLSQVVSAGVEVDGQTIYLSTSVGIARIGDRHGHAQDVLSDAEVALRKAKRNGGGEIAAFKTAEEPVAKAGSGPGISLESDLRHAISRGQMNVSFQPIMRLSDGTVAGFETLVRWHHPERGIILPGDFVPLAEETGMIVTIGRFVLSMAALQLAQWQSFFPIENPLFVTVNVSSRQLLKEDFVRDVGDVLDSINLAPHTLKLELTESMVAGSEDKVIEMLTALTKKGVSLAIDDYGTGHSSLSRLNTALFSVLKIDKEFVDNLGQRDQARKIVKSTIDLARDLSLQVVAEGVETELQMRVLHDLGCDYVQGFLLGAPLSPNDAQRFIAKHWNMGDPKKLPPPVSTSQVGR